MAEEGDVLTNLNPDQATNGADNLPVASLLSQYVKDLSVENPKAPESFQWRDQPELDVQFNIGARKINDEVQEVELKISANAKVKDASAYIVDLTYCGIVGLKNVTDEQRHAFIYAEAPRLLFPFALLIVAVMGHQQKVTGLQASGQRFITGIPGGGFNALLVGADLDRNHFQGHRQGLTGHPAGSLKLAGSCLKLVVDMNGREQAGAIAEHAMGKM